MMLFVPWDRDLEKIGVGRGWVRGGVSRRFGRGRGHEHERDGPIEKLIDLCDLLNIPFMRTNIRKEEVTAKLLELESLHATTDVLLADKEQAAVQDYEKEILNKRIAKLSGGAAVIQGVCWNSQFGIQRLSAETGAASIYCGF
ncbi:hypothetical protein E1A91_A11G205600v1 [Gossypium mustelinum]|uniref:Uncharacterized protein n=1 Tax=Gossypium mustelinum TaxID=34275 RepID=A0A5D2X8H1_GOSMU|nr:hypothetical protein E1A91_A11G205600v1 [Gossypium mustelinum]